MAEDVNPVNSMVSEGKRADLADRWHLGSTPQVIIVGLGRWETQRMVHGKSLRVIGQSLEIARVTEFEVENDGGDYLVQSPALTQTSNEILRNALTGRPSERTVQSPHRFTRLDISRLDSYAQKHRRRHSSAQTQGPNRLTQILRGLGDYLDRIGAGAFHISWTLDLISVDYKQADGQDGFRQFTPDKLQELGFHARFRRSSRNI